MSALSNLSLISQVPKMSLLPYLSKMSPLSYLFGQQGSSGSTPTQSGSIGSQGTSYGLPNLLQDILSGQLSNKQYARNALQVTRAPGSISSNSTVPANGQSGVHSDLLDRIQSPLTDDQRGTPSWVQLLIQLLPGLATILRQQDVHFGSGQDPNNPLIWH